MQADPYSGPGIQIHDLKFVPLITEEAVQARVKALGEALTGRFSQQNPLFISILSGAFVFASDLIRAFKGDCEIGFVKLSSYRGTASTGAIQTVMGLEKDLKDRHIIVVEDIVDTGRTLHYFLDQLEQHAPASICTVAFLRKPEATQFSVPVDYVGFDIEDQFVVGYGLDYEGLGRNLPGIYQLPKTEDQPASI
ncbi:MAG: hypoxanthine phosphoribosyltransferase [Saprospiraceae bacterium]|nr:hypoxanthine phosphoribosyltransferase [Saprospiraceae bacterium]